MGWLIRHKASKRNLRKIFLRRFLLSRFLAKTLRIIKINQPWKNFSKICHSESTLNYRSHDSCIKLTPQPRWCEKIGRCPNWRVSMANYDRTYIITMSIIILNYLQTPAMIFLYLMPFSSLKRQKMTASPWKKFHIRIVQLKNAFCP